MVLFAVKNSDQMIDVLPKTNITKCLMYRKVRKKMLPPNYVTNTVQ